MVIERLLGDFPSALFFEHYFLKQPFSRAGHAELFTGLGSWELIESILAQPDPDVLVVRQGRRWEGTAPPAYAQARRLHAEGYTLLVRHAQRHDPRLAELAASFEREFRGPADVHVYVTPAGEHGFGWHYDAEDVFILQSRGTKEYSLRKNTVNPWPLVETLPDDMRYEREIMPLAKCRLESGDWLYIPHGFWHMARALDESISLAVGVLAPSAIDLYDFLRTRLLSDIRWRQRLPRLDTSEMDGQSLEARQALLADLAADVARRLTDDALLDAFITSRKPIPDRRELT